MSNKSKYIDKKTIHEMLKPYAYKVVKDLAIESYRVIDEFYRDYDPFMYQRTFGMKNLFREKMTRTDNGYLIEFIYSPEYLTTEHRSNEAVFEGSFIYGWHGGKYAWGTLKKNVSRMQPSPWQLLRMYVKTYKI